MKIVKLVILQDLKIVITESHMNILSNTWYQFLKNPKTTSLFLEDCYSIPNSPYQINNKKEN